MIIYIYINGWWQYAYEKTFIQSCDYIIRHSMHNLRIFIFLSSLFRLRLNVPECSLFLSASQPARIPPPSSHNSPYTHFHPFSFLLLQLHFNGHVKCLIFYLSYLKLQKSIVSVVWSICWFQITLIGAKFIQYFKRWVGMLCLASSYYVLSIHWNQSKW